MASRWKTVWEFAVAGAIIMAAGCGGGSSSNGTSPTPTPANPTLTTTITISNNAVSPKNILVRQGSQVTFVNNDNQSHLMFSDPHPEHTDCPDINQVGFINPGQSLQTGNLNTVRTCGFHDHNQPSVTGLQGTITIQ